ncbi:MAG: hypothetical protein U1E56_13720 [Bauldia sp.]
MTIEAVARTARSPGAIKAALSHAGGRFVRFTLVSAAICVLVALASWRLARGAGGPICAPREALIARLLGDGLRAGWTMTIDGNSAALFAAPDGRMALVVDAAPGLLCVVATGVEFGPYRPTVDPKARQPPDPPPRDGA